MLLLFLLFSIDFPRSLADLQGTVSIRSSQQFSSLSPCVQGCLWNDSPAVLQILSCDVISPPNACYCPTDNVSRSMAFPAISACAALHCTNTLDYFSASRVYTAYCSGVALGAQEATSTTPPILTKTESKKPGLEILLGETLLTPLDGRTNPTPS
jgi:hypothetical protein